MKATPTREGARGWSSRGRRRYDGRHERARTAHYAHHPSPRGGRAAAALGGAERAHARAAGRNTDGVLSEIERRELDTLVRMAGFGQILELMATRQSAA